MEKNKIERTTVFKWNSRVELYNYFKSHFDLQKEIVDHTINNTLQMFRPRKYQVIKTQELWEKVGKILEQSCHARTAQV